MTPVLQLLIVDDEPLIVRTLTDILRLKGYRAKGAHSGEEAIAAVERCSYDIVLMDIRMPGFSGVEAFRTIKRCSPQTRVILMSAYMESEPATALAQEGVVRVLSKPIDIGELLALLRLPSA
ncbi:MAG: response regulator [Deltaproteobacteria bacterium]|nr:response regulator [Deltaproteobacteria bacterium]